MSVVDLLFVVVPCFDSVLSKATQKGTVFSVLSRFAIILFRKGYIDLHLPGTGRSECNFDHSEVWTRQSSLKTIYNKMFQYLQVKTV